MSPLSQNVTLDSSVTFVCQAENSDNYNWYFNSTPSYSLPLEYRRTISKTNQYAIGGRISSITIPSVSIFYNQTLIKCVAHPRESMSLTSLPALLLVQGECKCVVFIYTNNQAPGLSFPDHIYHCHHWKLSQIADRGNEVV